MPEEQGPQAQRSVFFHFTANLVFAGIALATGILFGMRVPVDRAALIAMVGALVLIPITRRWERTAIHQRRSDASGEPLQDRSEEPGVDS